MAKGVAGAKGVTVRTTAPEDTVQIVADLGSSLTRGERKEVSTEAVKRRVYLAGLVSLKRCLRCSSGAGPCEIHGEAALIAELGLKVLDSAIEAKRKAKEVAEAAEGREHKALVDLYYRRFEIERGAKPKISAQMAAAIKRIRLAHGFDGAKELLDAAFRDPKWVREGCPLGWLEKNPNGFATLRSSASTLQREA